MPERSIAPILDKASRFAGRPAPKAAAAGIAGAVSRGVARLTEMEQALSAPFKAIPFPAIPALRVLDLDVGLPHAHLHPPNLIPPNPVPIPLPSIGPVLPIPFLSGAAQVQINGRAAARCGDMGIAAWCGGFFPVFEVFLGSATVWIEGARAARQGVDITLHCGFSMKPKPTDPPVYPWAGLTLSGSRDVYIGGLPLPSATSWVIGKAIQGAFKGLRGLLKGARALRRLRGRGARVAARFSAEGGADLAAGAADRGARAAAAPVHGGPLDELLQRLEIHGSDDFRATVMDDLNRIARTESGRELLEDLNAVPKALGIHEPLPGSKYHEHFERFGPSLQPHSYQDGLGSIRTNRKGEGVLRDIGRGPEWTTIKRGAGTGADVVYQPAAWPNASAPGTTSDTVLLHELVHARNFARGEALLDDALPDADWLDRWSNMEEFETVQLENRYRADQGYPERHGHTTMP